MFALSIFIEKHDSWIEKFTELGVWAGFSCTAAKHNDEEKSSIALTSTINVILQKML